MQMNHRIPINSHHELKKAEAFKHLENIRIVLQKKKSLNFDLGISLHVHLQWEESVLGYLISAKLL